MQLHWVAVSGQMVNFLVLVWLLHHLLSPPITQAMERREKRIAERLRDAAEKKKEAAAEADKYRQQQEDLERRRQDLLDQAREEASEEKESLQQSARDEVARRKEEWHAQLEEQTRACLAAGGNLGKPASAASKR